MKQNIRDIDAAAKDIASFVKLFVFNRVQYKYPTFDEYNNRSLQKGYKSTDLMKLCHIDREIITNLASYAAGKYYKLTDIWPMLEPQIKHHGKLSKKFKSGKTFNLLSWYSLSDETLKALYKKNTTVDDLTPRAKRAWLRFINSQQSNTIDDIDTDEDKPMDELKTKNEESARRAAARAAKRHAPKSETAKPKARADKTIAPENDIPEEEYVIASTQAASVKPLPMPTTTSEDYVARLRALVKSKAMGIATARHFAKIVGNDGTSIREPASGASWEDFEEHLQEQLDALKSCMRIVKANNIQVAQADENWLKSTYNALVHKIKNV